MNNNEQGQVMLEEQEKTILMSNDNGMGNNKITYGIDGKYYQFDFPSMYKEVEKQNADTIIINDRIFNFSEGRLAVENGHQTKDDEMHEILLQKAIYEVYKRTNVKNFDVITNYSLDSYKDDGGQKVLDRMSKIKTIKVKELYKDEVELKINRIDCYAECLTGGLTVKLKLREEDVVFIDIGTRNIQLIRVSKGVPRYETSKSIKNKGMSSIYRGVADITKTLPFGINDTVAVQMYLEKTKKGKLDKINEIEGKILEYLMASIYNELDQCLDEMQVSPLFTKYVFLGGGSDLLSRFLDAKFIKEHNTDPIYVDDPYFATSLGLFRKGERLYNYEKHQDANKCEEEKTKKTTTKKPRATKKETVKQS